MPDHEVSGTSTPPATAAVAQTREPGAGSGRPPEPCPGEGTDFLIGPGIAWAAQAMPYTRRRNDPIYRPLRIYTRDPGEPSLEGAVATVNVPYEDVEPGPRGAVLEVDDYDVDRGHRYGPVNLDDPRVLIANGRPPSPGDHQFHQQMVYAVCSSTYAAFRQALGRHPGWGFAGRNGGPGRLRILPHAMKEENAYYDPELGELRFGYYRADPERVEGRNVPGGWVFTCLSHDVVVHEVTHALLDGLRAHFAKPTSADVLAFHEAFADMVALFQHFTYREVVLAGIRFSGGKVVRSRLLMDLATQFGHTVPRKGGAENGPRSALRTPVQLDENGELKPRVYDPALPRYELASVLVSAVFDAFSTLFRKKTERSVRLATGGTGILPPGEMPHDLREILAKEASDLAAQFLNLCIRAIDYCPPVDLHFGEFLRAVVTADHDVVAHDPWGYREAWMDAFARHRIYPPGVTSLSEDALLWNSPARNIVPVAGLSFAELKFRGDPARPADEVELRRQACLLGQLVSAPEMANEFGCVVPGDPALGGDPVSLPCVQSVRSSRRVGPDGQVVFDLVAEVTQTRTLTRGGERMPFYGGATVIIDPEGQVRYVIGKSVLNQARMDAQTRFMTGEGRRFWKETAKGLVPAPLPFRILHQEG